MIEVRTFQDPDFPRLLEIDQACFEPGIAYDKVTLRYFIYRIYSHTLVMVSDSKVVGFGIAATSTDRGQSVKGHIITLDLLPELRGQGLGKSLLSRLEGKLSSDGAKELVLEVDVKNSGAIGFYRRMGYSTERKLKNYYGHHKDAIRMVKRLEHIHEGAD